MQTWPVPGGWYGWVVLALALVLDRCRWFWIVGVGVGLVSVACRVHSMNNGVAVGPLAGCSSIGVGTGVGTLGRGVAVVSVVVVVRDIWFVVDRFVLCQCSARAPKIGLRVVVAVRMTVNI